MSDQPPVTRVSIDTPPLTITVEAPGITLEQASAEALALYRATWRDDMVRPVGAGGVGFAAERSMD